MESEKQKALGQRIKFLRERKNLSQEELASKVGYTSRSSINKIEMGKNDIPMKKLYAFAIALGVTPAIIMGTDTLERYEHDKNNYQPISNRLNLSTPFTYVFKRNDEKELLKIAEALPPEKLTQLLNYAKFLTSQP